MLLLRLLKARALGGRVGGDREGREWWTGGHRSKHTGTRYRSLPSVTLYSFLGMAWWVLKCQVIMLLSLFNNNNNNSYNNNSYKALFSNQS